MTDHMVDEYVERLRKETRDLPRGERRELVEEIEGHIQVALTERPGAGEADVRNVLERIGEPGTIAAEARTRLGIRPTKFGAAEVAAVILLPVGGLVVPVVGWVVGVILLWTSPAWTVREKLAATLLFPGGLLLPGAMLLLSASGGGGTCVSTGPVRGGAAVSSCTSSTTTLEVVLLSILVVVLVVVPIVTAIVLGRRARRRAALTAPEG